MAAAGIDGLEDVLERAVRTGKLLDLAPKVSDADLNPGHAEAWPPERWVPAEMLRAVLLGPHSHPDPRGLRLRGALVTAGLDLDHADLPWPLVLMQCHLQQPATLEYATVPHLGPPRTHVSGLVLDGTHVKGGLDLEGLTATGEIRATGLLRKT